MIHYVLDNAKPEAEGRFDALAAIFDAGTKRHVETLGPVDNWRCLEVAAGGRLDRAMAGRQGRPMRAGRCYRYKRRASADAVAAQP